MANEIRTPAILQKRNFELGYGATELLRHGAPYSSISPIESLEYMTPFQLNAPFRTILDVKEGLFNRSLNNISKLRTKAITELQSGIPHGQAYRDYTDALSSFVENAHNMSSKVITYSKDMASSFSGNALADERRTLSAAANSLTSAIDDVIKGELEVAEKLRGNKGVIAVSDAVARLNRNVLDINKAFSGFQNAESKLRAVGEAFRKVVKLPWQKQITPKEFYTYKPDFSAITSRIERLASSFGLDSSQVKLTRAILEGSDPAILGSIDKMIESGNKAGFFNWLSKEANAMTAVAQDLTKSGVKLAGVSADATTSLAKNIKDKGEAIAAEVSKFASENKIAGSAIDKIKDFLSMKDFKNVFKVCEQEPQAKSLLTNTCLKYGGLIGLGAAAIAGLTMYQRKQDRDRQEAKYTRYGGVANG